MSETAWHPEGYNIKPNISHFQWTKCPHSWPCSCVPSAHVRKAGRDCHPPFPGGQQSERQNALCQVTPAIRQSLTVGTDEVPGMGTVCTLRLIKFCTTVLRGRNEYPRCTDVETEAERGEAIWPKSRSGSAEDPDRSHGSSHGVSCL